MCEYDIEREHREHIQPPKQKSIPEKDRQAQFLRPTGRGTVSESIPSTKRKLRKPNLTISQSASPLALGWWDPWHLEHTRDGGTDSEVSLHRGIVHIYIRSRPLLWAPDVDGWRMKDQFQRIFLSTDPDNDELKALIHDCFYMPRLTGDCLD